MKGFSPRRRGRPVAAEERGRFVAAPVICVTGTLTDPGTVCQVVV
ncbi:hypothetical protein [Streptomyces sp. NPDC088910]